MCTSVAQWIEQVSDVNHGSRVRSPPEVHTLSSPSVRRAGLLLFWPCMTRAFKSPTEINLRGFCSVTLGYIKRCDSTL